MNTNFCLASFVDAGISIDNWLLLFVQVIDVVVGALLDLDFRLELHGRIAFVVDELVYLMMYCLYSILSAINVVCGLFVGTLCTSYVRPW